MLVIAITNDVMIALMALATQATRMLDARGIPYELVEYDPAATFHTGRDAAALLGVDESSVFKTLVVLRGDGEASKPLLVVAPVAAQVDLKVLAGEVGAKKLRMATQREAERITGMQAGGISALALQRPDTVSVVIDESAILVDTIHVSAGRRGLDISLRSRDFIAVTGARVLRVTKR